MIRTLRVSFHCGPLARPCVALFTLALCLAVAPIDAQHVEHRVAGVRSSNPLIAHAVRSGVERSRTFAALYEEVERLGGIVLIEEGRCRGGSRACLLHAVTWRPPYRFLFIDVRLQGVGTELIVTLGHELVHALEVLREPQTDTHAEIYHLFARIGLRTDGPSFETAAAVAIERRIDADLRRSGNPSRSPRDANNQTASRDPCAAPWPCRSEAHEIDDVDLCGAFEIWACQKPSGPHVARPQTGSSFAD